MLPSLLEPNQSERFFRGGARIARFRGVPPRGEHVPEDWVASTTVQFGEREAGLTRLPDGTLLRDAVEKDPVSFLGPAHVRELGTDIALLVKLLDPGQRLPVHCHPSPEFARHHLGSVHGKNEAWIVLGVDDSDDAVVHLGFKKELQGLDVAALVERQDSATLLNALHRVPVHPGDTVFVPAGMPHAIGAGVFVLELQEPTDFSVMLEWEAFGLSGEGQLGLPLDTALGCLDRSRLPVADVLRLCADRPHESGTDARIRHLFPVAADPYFRARRIRPLGDQVALPAAFSVLVVRAGKGELLTEYGGEKRPLPLHRGATVLVPYAAGPLTIRGDIDVFQCLPPGS
ncbi:hypothetical protein CTZ27_31575 [Streptomyces griseocarneus]|nr:hypothetical protein CTZ27_31575 [Streptomyces griseocarneus]